MLIFFTSIICNIHMLRQSYLRSSVEHEMSIIFNAMIPNKRWMIIIIRTVVICTANIVTHFFSRCHVTLNIKLIIIICNLQFYYYYYDYCYCLLLVNRSFFAVSAYNWIMMLLLRLVFTPVRRSSGNSTGKLIFIHALYIEKEMC